MILLLCITIPFFFFPAIRKWWSTFCWDESSFTLFTCPKCIDSPQVEEVVHIGLQEYLQFMFLYTSKRSANFQDLHKWKYTLICKPRKNNLCKQLTTKSCCWLLQQQAAQRNSKTESWSLFSQTARVCRSTTISLNVLPELPDKFSGLCSLHLLTQYSHLV